MAARDKRGRETEILEHGDIYFFYRPKVDTEEAEGLDDVQRFHVVLRPHGRGLFRLITIGRKRLPDIGQHERTWGFVDMVAKSAREIEQALRQQSYDTKTRGQRTRPAARPAGEGVYALVQAGSKLFLVYELELPKRPAEVQQELKIPPQGSFAISIKNPEAPAPPGVGLGKEQEADYPNSLQREFRGRRFATEDVRLLDYPGAEFVIVGARLNPERELGIELEAEEESLNSADIFRSLHVDRSRYPVEPLLQGKWR
jgi:hypothetical protein